MSTKSNNRELSRSMYIREALILENCLNNPIIRVIHRNSLHKIKIIYTKVILETKKRTLIKI